MITNKFPMLTDDVLRLQYREAKSVYKLAKELNKQFPIDKGTLSARLKKLPDWKLLQSDVEGVKALRKNNIDDVQYTCEYCGNVFVSKKRKRYCSKKCIQTRWMRNFRKQNRDEINVKRREKRALTDKKITVRIEWKQRFYEKVKSVHKRKLDSVVDKILRRIDTTKNSTVVRSRKYKVPCTITIEELRQLVYDAYANPCKYCEKILTINNLVTDHIHPISKTGSSNKENLQIICKMCNNMKGSLDEDSFIVLLNWLKTVPENLRKDISIRLAHGIH